MTKTLFILFICASATTCLGQMQLHHQIDAIITNLEAIGATSNGFIFMIKEPTKKNLVLFDLSGNQVAQTDLQNEIEVVGYTETDEQVNVVVNNSSKVNQLEVVTLRQNQLKTAALANLSTEEQILVQFSHKNKIFILTVSRKPSRKIIVHQIDNQNKIQSSAFSIDETLSRQLSEKGFSMKFIDTEKENSLADLDSKNKVYLRDNVVLLTLTNRLGHLEGNIKLVELDMDNNTLNQREVNTPYAKAPAPGSYVLDNQIFISKIRETTGVFDLVVLDYQSLKEKKHFHYEGSDSVTIKKSSVFENGEVIDTDWTIKNRTRKLIVRCDELYSVQRLNDDRIRILFGSRYYPSSGGGGGVTMGAGGTMTPTGGPAMVSTVAVETYFVSFLDKNYNPTKGNEVVGIYEESEKRIRKIADDLKYKFMSHFETGASLYTAFLLKKKNELILYKFEKNEIRHYTPVFKK